MLILLAVAFVACEEKENAGNNNGGNEQTNQGGGDENKVSTYDTITAVLEGSNIKTAWAEGDAIQVYNVTQDGVDKEAKYVLSAGAGTASGTFKPAEGVNALETGGKGYFAAYPYDEDLTFAQHNTFSTTISAEQTGASPLFAYAEDAKTIKFGSFMGAIKFTITGKGSVAGFTLDDANSNNILSGNVTVNPKTGKVSFKNGSASKHSVSYKLAEKAVLDNTTSGEIVIEVPEGTLSEGGKLTVKDANDSPLAMIDVPAQTIAKGVISNAGNLAFTAELQTVDLGIAGLANCYIIKDVGKYQFDAVKGNDSSAKLAAASAALLWETWGTAEDVTPNSLVKSVTIQDGKYVLVETADKFHAGDAVVAVKDADGKILWAWTLWFTDAQIATVTVREKYDLMDRNLGALSASKEEPGLNYGLLYQWGRPTGFPGCDGTKVGKPAKCAPVWSDVFTAESLSAAGEKTVQDGIENPTVFFKGKTHWTLGGAEEEELWANNAKTLYDPCPAGYKVPDYDYSDGPFSSISNADAYELTESVGVEMDGLFYPFAGYIKYSASFSDTEGGYNSDGAYGMYWTSLHKTGNDGVTFENAQSMQASSKKLSYDRKASAFSVRCQKLGTE